MISSKPRLVIPYGLKTLLEGVSRAVLKVNPSNINQFAASYFKELIVFREVEKWSEGVTQEKKTECVKESEQTPLICEEPKRMEKSTDTAEDNISATSLNNKTTQFPSFHVPPQDEETTEAICGPSKPATPKSSTPPSSPSPEVAYVPADPAQFAAQMLGKTSSINPCESEVLMVDVATSMSTIFKKDSEDERVSIKYSAEVTDQGVDRVSVEIDLGSKAKDDEDKPLSCPLQDEQEPPAEPLPCPLQDEQEPPAEPLSCPLQDEQELPADDQAPECPLQANTTLLIQSIYNDMPVIERVTLVGQIPEHSVEKEQSPPEVESADSSVLKRVVSEKSLHPEMNTTETGNSTSEQEEAAEAADSGGSVRSSIVSFPSAPEKLTAEGPTEPEDLTAAGSTEAEGSAEPEEPTEEEGSAEPEDLTEAEGPTEPEDLTEAEGPAEPEELTEAEGPAEPEDLTEAEGPAEPEELTEAEGPAEPEELTEAEGPAEPEELTEAEGSAEPEELTEAEGPAEPEELTEAEGSAEPEELTEAEGPAEPEDLTEAEGPAEPEDLTEAEGPAEPEELTEAEGPAEPEEPTEAEGPAEPEDLTEAEGPAEPEDLTEAEGPAEPEKDKAPEQGLVKTAIAASEAGQPPPYSNMWTLYCLTDMNQQSRPSPPPPPGPFPQATLYLSNPKEPQFLQHPPKVTSPTYVMMDDNKKTNAPPFILVGSNVQEAQDWKTLPGHPVPQSEALKRYAAVPVPIAVPAEHKFQKHVPTPKNASPPTGRPEGPRPQSPVFLSVAFPVEDVAKKVSQKGTGSGEKPAPFGSYGIAGEITVTTAHVRRTES
ncbi:calcium-binding tyrosine phosphorylation-regulated protein isoform X2 [Sorex araneus]|uniref:calcium-binding tyrosine phosphorylation-regulated protein isoform X2 n=1 Tax=Sorex araneus TaxID=42254 RepID=UPI0024335281|nr:calcium-binding tyrosine phosphorylation-regulated protein isoform X2 [Sorex araneus]